MEQPMLGRWYRRFGGVPFQVVGVDHESGVIEIQSAAGGALEELHLEQWNGLAVESAGEPGDSAGGSDEAEAGNLSPSDPEILSSGDAAAASQQGAVEHRAAQPAS